MGVALEVITVPPAAVTTTGAIVPDIEVVAGFLTGAVAIMGETLMAILGTTGDTTGTLEENLTVIVVVMMLSAAKMVAVEIFVDASVLGCLSFTHF